jgi:hypothetical protein
MYAPVITDRPIYTDARGIRPTIGADVALLRNKGPTQMQVDSTNDSYVHDSRYPALSAVMSDARQFTDYRSRCTANIAPEMQFKTKQWLQMNAMQVMEASRHRHAERMGATEVTAQITGPGASVIQRCTPDGCTIESTGDFHGIGIERANTWSQSEIPLFGSFQYAPKKARAGMNVPLITTKQEGGRNTVRG